MISKEDVLNYILDSKDAVSGQKIAGEFNVSRGAIWKIINSLNEEGYKIKGKSNFGYYSDPNINIYSKNYLNRYLNQPFHIEIFDTLDSTSTYLKRIADDYNMSTLVCAYQQTNGRGRTGKSFYSPLKGLYFSFAFKAKEIKDTSLVTIKVAVAVIDALQEVLNKKCQIKWVNDIYYQNKKIVGILSEATIDFESKEVDKIIVGIGVNLKFDKIPEELKDVATSLDIDCCNKNLLIATIINNFFKEISIEDTIKTYKENCLLLGKEINFTINNINYHGIAKDINKHGHLIVEANNEVIELRSGEVSLGSINYGNK